ncbi:MAG: hypothetical protein KI790_05505, partial [Cyclobacteriaceae bacterium]|nr:hypothetical protein [Cyclobacteriaceae bacterium HetDA_MAG_MS6]
QGLLNGSEELDLVDVNNTDEVLALFDEIQPLYNTITTSAENVLSISGVNESWTQPTLQSLNQILQNEGEFLRIMNAIVFQYDNEASSRVSTLSTTEYILFAIAITLLIMEALIIFRPAINRINEYTSKLIKQEKSLQKSLDQQKYLNNQAEAIFANVKQGIFLLDEELMINEFYSKETEEIFDNKELAGSNFLKLMRPRLVQRDLDALEMFVEHLFNPDIREKVVNKLNPVEQVEIFTDKNLDDAMEARYIRISFARITNGREILKILVTVLDETENIRMKKQIEEAEERNKLESTQLLAILKVNPSLLQDYLKNTKKELQSISEKYEAHKGVDFSDLIRFTFNTIHNAKGNATLIGLDLVEDKLHLIEDSIVELRRKKGVEGKDFLKALYEVTEVIAVLENMEDMLLKIADVYNKMSDESPQIKSNELLISTLKKGLNKISNEKSKPAKLNFNDNGVILPDQYQLDIKDMSIQLIRNSITHGIEESDDRAFGGKPEEATISITLDKSADGNLNFSYEDDGRGLDLAKIGRIAIDKEIVTESELETMSSQEVVDLIFKDGFSTADKIDQYAGRGQGLSLIRQIADKNNGGITINHESGKYFKITIALPLEERHNLKQAV